MGARQFVVQEAFEMIRCSALRMLSLTPKTIVASSLSLGGAAQDHPVGAGVEVLLQGGPVREEAGRLEGDLGLQRLSGKVGGILLLGDLDLFAVDDQGLLARLDGPLERPVNAVVLQKQCEVLGVREVVDRDNLEVIGPRSQCPKHKSANPAKTIDTNSNGHSSRSWLLRKGIQRSNFSPGDYAFEQRLQSRRLTESEL